MMPRRDSIRAGLNQGISVPDDRMIGIDKAIDDGDLTTGTFMKRADRFIYILQK